MMALMKAVVFEKSGKPEHQVRVLDVEIPVPHGDDVLVRVETRPVQPADLMFIEGRYRIKPAVPQIAGLEGTGTVVATASRNGIAVGTRVAFRHPGAWAEYATVPGDRLYAVPEGIDGELAAQFSLNPVTAWALLDELNVEAGDWIAINAATSHIAQLANGLCRRRGIKLLGLIGEGRNVPAGLLSVTGDVPSLADAVLEATNGTLLAGLLDSLGGAAVTGMLPTLRQGATIVSFAVLTSDVASLANADLIYRNLTWKGFGIDYWLATSGDRRPRMVEELWTAIRDADISLPVRGRYRLEDAPAALADAARPGPIGKVLIVG